MNSTYRTNSRPTARPRPRSPLPSSSSLKRPASSIQSPPTRQQTVARLRRIYVLIKTGDQATALQQLAHLGKALA